MGNSALLNATEMSGKLSVLENAPGIQNKIFSSHFLSSLDLLSNVEPPPHTHFHGRRWSFFSKCSSCGGFWVLTTLPFRLSSPGRSDGSISLTFLVVLRRKLAIWQWLLNVLLAWLARMDTGAERSTEIPRFC